MTTAFANPTKLQMKLHFKVSVSSLKTAVILLYSSLASYAAAGSGRLQRIGMSLVCMTRASDVLQKRVSYW